jgi:hypothetical protein
LWTSQLEELDHQLQARDVVIAIVGDAEITRECAELRDTVG